METISHVYPETYNFWTNIK